MVSAANDEDSASVSGDTDSDESSSSEECDIDEECHVSEVPSLSLHCGLNCDEIDAE